MAGYNLVKVAWWSTQSFGHSTSAWRHTDSHTAHCVGRQKGLWKRSFIPLCLTQGVFVPGVYSRGFGQGEFLFGGGGIFLWCIWQWHNKQTARSWSTLITITDAVRCTNSMIGMLIAFFAYIGGPWIDSWSFCHIFVSRYMVCVYCSRSNFKGLEG